MAGVTIFAIISWWFTPESAWLPSERISQFMEKEELREGEMGREVGNANSQGLKEEIHEDRKREDLKRSGAVRNETLVK